MSMIDFTAIDSEEEDSNDLMATDSEEDPSYSIENETSDADEEDSEQEEEVSEDSSEELVENWQDSNDEEDSDDEEESPEYQSFCQHSSQLLHVISNPQNFAKRLFSAHIISDRVLSDIQKRRRAKHGINKKRKLLKTVKNLIQADPGKFEALLKVMSQCSSSSLAAVGMKMKRSCGRLSFLLLFIL